MIASQEKTLQPLASIPVEQAAAQERPKRARKPNPKFAEDPEATASPSTATRNARRRRRRRRSAVRLSARKDQSAVHGAVDGMVIDVGSRNDLLVDPPLHRDYQSGSRNVHVPVVCRDHVMEPSPGNNEARGDGNEPPAKKPRPSPIDLLIAAVEKIEGDENYWTSEKFRLLGLGSEKPTVERTEPEEEPSQPLPRPRRQKKQKQEQEAMQPTQPRRKKPRQGRGTAAKSTPSQQPAMDGTCQRTDGCDKGFRHTGFCKAHKVNSRENRMRRALANQ